MRRPKEVRRRNASALDCALSKRHVAADVLRRLEMKLPVEVSVVSELMSFMDSAMNNVGPSLRMPSQNEERCANAVLGKRIEDARRSIGIGPVIERQRNFFSIGRKMAEHAAEDKTVSMKRAVYRASNHRKSKCRWKNHGTVFTPRTPA
jgi:hypothetical protein